MSDLDKAHGQDAGETFTLRVHSAIREIPAAAWDACAGDANPTVSHVFLNALEESGSATARAGWAPQHLTLEDREGHVVGAVPIYLKSHSYGEYVFDWGWADAYERAGGRYYPKVLCAVPFTSLHINFPDDEDFAALGEAGFLQRVGQQFHWTNEGYRDFDDYLAALNSRKRKAVKKERREALAGGIEIDLLTGSALTETAWDAFYDLYLGTSDRKWGSAYLTRRFFSMIGERMPDNVVLFMARRGGRYIAGAFNLLGRDTIYGRNWGAHREYRFLHFECCYYRAIEFAIKGGLKRVEAGAQGPHKLQRGYLPVPIYSAHWIPDQRFRQAVAAFLARERDMVEHKIERLAEFSPFRHEEEQHEME